MRSILSLAPQEVDFFLLVYSVTLYLLCQTLCRTKRVQSLVPSQHPSPHKF